MKPNIVGYKPKLEVKKVTLADLEATYCMHACIFGPASEEDVKKAIQDEINQFKH